MLSTSVLVLLLGVCKVLGNMTCSTCTQQEICTAYLDAAIEMIRRGKCSAATDLITKAKHHIPSDYDCTHCPKDCSQCSSDCPECPREEKKAVDCADLLNLGHNRSGVYRVWPTNRVTRGKPITVYCDMDTDGGGWTVIQRRGDFGSPKDYFYREWSSYREGFGKLEKDFWLGNDNIFVLTNEKYYSARFDLMDFEHNRRYARYDNFWIDNEDCKYTLHISGYSGDAGDAMVENNNQAFSTKDRRHDSWKKSCAAERKAAWWYKACTLTNLNGLYHRGKYQGSADGVYWGPWKGSRESLKWTEIKIRPNSFRPSLRSKV